MNKKVRLLGVVAIITLMVLLAFSPNTVQICSISNSPSGTSSSQLTNGSANLLYIIRSGSKDIMVQSIVYIIGNSVMITTSFLSHDQTVSTCTALSDITVQSQEFPAGIWHTSFDTSMGKGNWSLVKLVKGNKDGLVSYASVTVQNKILGINKTLSVCLEKVTLSQGLNFNTLDQAGLYLFFIPQLISPNTSSTSISVNPGLVLPASADPNGNCLRLTELDNTLANFHVWHLQANLSAWSPTYGGYSDSYMAKATSVNWWLESSSLSTSVSVGYQIEACANAFFYGVFPLGPLDLWYAYPQVDVTSAFTSSGIITSGSINDPIFVQSLYPPLVTLWSDAKVNINSFSGYKDVQEYII